MNVPELKQEYDRLERAVRTEKIWVSGCKRNGSTLTCIRQAERRLAKFEKEFAEVKAQLGMK